MVWHNETNAWSIFFTGSFCLNVQNEMDGFRYKIKNMYQIYMFTNNVLC